MSEFTKSDASWITAEKWYLRFIGVGLGIVAVLGGIFGFYSGNDIAALAMNIVTIVLSAIAAFVSIFWSMSDDRVEKMVEGFKEKGASRTYIFMIVQILIGALFALEGASGSIAAGAFGIIILGSAGFYFWRAQQISAY